MGKFIIYNHLQTKTPSLPRMPTKARTVPTKFPTKSSNEGQQRAVPRLQQQPKALLPGSTVPLGMAPHHLLGIGTAMGRAAAPRSDGTIDGHVRTTDGHHVRTTDGAVTPHANASGMATTTRRGGVPAGAGSVKSSSDGDEDIVKRRRNGGETEEEQEDGTTEEEEGMMIGDGIADVDPSTRNK
jgi:hypothetical protein